MTKYIFLFFIICAQVYGATFQTDGSLSGVQNAINTANSGDTVVIPNGVFSWNGGVSIQNKAIHLHGASKGGVTIRGSGSTAVVIYKTSAGISELDNIIFQPGGAAGDIYHTFHVQTFGSWTDKPILMHDCDFYNGGGYCQYTVEWDCNGGVVWNCRFFGAGMPTLNGISFVLKGQDSTWTTADTFGSRDTTGFNNTYIEDCSFDRGFNACINADDDSRVVVRHCLITNACLADHGGDTSLYGVRQQEFYNNTFIYNPATDYIGGNLNSWFYLRGGPGIVANNIIPDIPFGKVEIIFENQSLRRNAGPYACWKTYPVPRQIGQGWANGSYIVEGFYLWGNTGTGIGNVPSLSDYPCGDVTSCPNCTSCPSISTFLVNGRDYFANTPKPGWTPYTYPHPLRGGIVAVPPIRPQNLRIIH